MSEDAKSDSNPTPFVPLADSAIKPSETKPDDESGSPNRNKTENLADRIKILSVTFDQSIPPGNGTPGTYIHIKWRNDTGRPLREVKGTLHITDNAGDPISGAPSDIWLYTDSNPLMPGKIYTSHDYVGGSANFDEIKPTHDNLVLDYATEAAG